MVLVTITIAYAYKYYGVVGVLFVLLIAEFLLQVYKMVYQHKAVRVKYDTSHVINITNCWAIYQILNNSLLTGGVFTYLIMLAEIEALNIPKRVWLVVVIILACAWSIITIQPFVRKEKYDFTTPYAYIRTALVVKNDNTEITTFDDLKGKKTSNSLGSTYADMAADLGADVQNVDTLSETIDMVLSGRVDATLNAEVSFYDYLGEHPDAPIKIVALTDEASEVSIPLRKGDESASLRAAIDEAIQEMAADGTLSELSTKYFGQDITK